MGTLSGVSQFLISTGWRPVVAVFYYIFISCIRNKLSSDSMILSK